MTKENWEYDFDTLIGRPVSGARIKEFIRELLKKKQNEQPPEEDPKECV